jgi:glyoxylase-like metal-dependent hydrolase (beta-lactamase superfamily II)
LPVQLIDLRHLGREQVIGAWRVGDVVIDPGPASCLETLLQALGGEPPRVLALTHIHLDHAGATGALLARYPEIEVWVHERGAAHLVDPSKLVASAGRLYGERMQILWGEILPVPAERLRVLVGGERLDGFRVAYTPGHASHHVSYLHEHSGQVFSGDVAGVRIGTGPVLAPTPPPDIDLGLWRQSLQALADWRPTTLAPTHFGCHDDVERHLAELTDCLARFEEWARTLTPAAFAQALRADLATRTSPVQAEAYTQAMPPEQTFAGLERYLSLRK